MLRARLWEARKAGEGALEPPTRPEGAQSQRHQSLIPRRWPHNQRRRITVSWRCC